MSNETKAVKCVVLRDNVPESVKHAELYKTFREILTQKYDEKEKEYFKEVWIPFSFRNQKGYWNKNLQTAVPVQKVYEVLESTYFDIESSEMDDNLVAKLFDNKSSCPSEIMNGIKKSKSFNGGHWVGCKEGSFCVETERYSNWNDDDSVHVGVVSVKSKDFKNAIISGKYEITSDDILKKAVSVMKTRSVSELSENEIDDLLKIFSVDREKISDEVDERVLNNFVMTKDVSELYIKGLLECDTVRADLEKYDSKCLEDVNSGHWELWSDDEPVAKEGKILVELEQPLRARNPVNDIHENGLIGIDFGTKSTIVSVQDGHEHITLLRVGVGRLNKAPEAHHYENPTIMEFINLEKFIRDYNSRSGRPETSINDLRVSHSAERDLKSCDNNNFFDSFFYDIKQWCGDDKRSVKIIDQQRNNTEHELPPFVSLDHDEFNPLELYAYYLGLYINNMHEGIYLEYVLSFPVTYKLDVKEKILESFRAGLWKSMPESIQNNEKVKNQFRVRMGVSEPAAYAITALQGYGFEPEDEKEKYFYSIFDFGGGTTDFDFGIWRGADISVREEEDKDYVIEHISSEGDKYLGGENLLELLAFEVFRANNDFMRTGKISETDDNAESAGFSFTLPHGCIKPSGCEMTIKDSPSAKRNTKQLMEVLRPFWEGIISTAESDVKISEDEKAESKTIEYHGYIFRNDEKYPFPVSDDGALTVDLFDNNGELQSGQKLYIENQKKEISVDLIKILEARIERGVQSFFEAAAPLFDDEIVDSVDVDEMHIFLAGNSSKSPILKKIFNEYIEKENKELNGGESGKSHFILYPPLGTPEAIELQEELGVEVNTDITAPTGKTGVAYGLIYGREGGPVRVISEVKAESQTKFRFNIGKARKGKFSVVLDRNDAVYGEWVRFGVASSEDFEIYYTSLPGAAKMSVTDPSIHKIRCRISDVNPDADIYIRTVEEAPEDIEYSVSAGKKPDKDSEVVHVHLSE
ncbi:MAG: hypothetical protein Q4D76_14365 [Oscillospiraceae bacterium]|nr:hypothetical protein [Oscillospiraceae bacterium]